MEGTEVYILLDFFFFSSPERIGLNFFSGSIEPSPPLNTEPAWRASLGSENLNAPGLLAGARK